METILLYPKLKEEQVLKNDSFIIKELQEFVFRPLNLQHPKLLRSIIEHSGKKVYDFVLDQIGYMQNILVGSTSSQFYLLKNSHHAFSAVINLKKINDIKSINAFFESVNDSIPYSGVFIGCVETYSQRYASIRRKYPWFMSRSFIFFDFVFHRVIPKIKYLRTAYLFLTKGRGQVLSRAETFGRLVCCGFSIVDYKTINGLTYFVVLKEKNPEYNGKPSCCGPLVKLPRIGKNGNRFNVYKFRTMHPYSEYLQEYVYKMNNLEEGGKFKNDFRINSVGRLMRKLWIDELPMFYNLIKGNMKLIGVRPLSSHYFSLYSVELQEKRTKTKPGLLPPFYVDLPKTLDEIQASEMRYLEQYFENPLRTDIKYFFKILKNILFKKVRSK